MRMVELPLAASTILAGIKISAVINVGTAVLALLAQGVFELLERMIVPRGLRLKGEG